MRGGTGAAGRGGAARGGAARGGAGLALAAVLGLALAGCSQVSALAPVGGNSLAEVRYGAIDVLLANGVEVLEAPVCSTDADGVVVRCSGSTVPGEAITVVSSTADDAQLEVSVGSETLYSGSLQAVIDEAARG